MISRFVLYLLVHVAGRWENYQGKSSNWVKWWWSLISLLLLLLNSLWLRVPYMTAFHASLPMCPLMIYQLDVSAKASEAEIEV